MICFCKLSQGNGDKASPKPVDGRVQADGSFVFEMGEIARFGKDGGA
jgi:hypothetical protein